MLGFNDWFLGETKDDKGAGLIYRRSLSGKKMGKTHTKKEGKR